MARGQACGSTATADIIAEGWQRGRSAWPRVEVALEQFGAYVGARLPEEARPDADADSGSLHFADLYLACACASGDAVALASLDDAFGAEIERTIARIKACAGRVEEVRQLVRQRLFIPSGDRRPKIAEYSGKGELRTWLRIVATRTALNFAASPSREVPFDAEALQVLVGAGEDPELRYFKRMYADQFRVAFADALSTLASRDRNLLRYALGSGLSIDAVGALYNVHRATAARWIQRAHERLVAKLRGSLTRTMGVGAEELRSILRLIESQLHITMDRYLGT